MPYQIIKPRGTNDWYGLAMLKMDYLVALFTKLSQAYGYQHVITPTFESKAVFIQSLGTTSEVVNKQFFHLLSLNKTHQYVLRPENTASIIRMVVNNQLIHKQPLPLKFYYHGPMFRYERPQTGRLREFFQYGIEIIGLHQITDQIEVLLFCQQLLAKLGLANNVRLKINYLADDQVKTTWNNDLKQYFQPFIDQLSPLNQQRATINPIRILDDKADQGLDCVQNAPKIIHYLPPTQIANYQKIKDQLTSLNIHFQEDDSLVRGFDYYCGLVFEYVWSGNDQFNSTTIIGGGQYQNQLLKFLDVNQSCFGFGLGIDRLIQVLDAVNFPWPIAHNQPVGYLAQLVLGFDKDIWTLLNHLREEGLTIITNWKTTKLAAHFKAINYYDPQFMLIYGQQEQKEKTIMIRNQKTKQQKTFLLHEINSVINYLKNNN